MLLKHGSYEESFLLPTFRRRIFDLPGEKVCSIYEDLSDPKHVHGVLLAARADQNIWELRDYGAYLFCFGLRSIPRFEPDASGFAQKVATIFEETLMYDVHDHRGWLGSGKELFIRKAQYYTDRKIPVHFALPAFPCKTTNPNKAASKMPDGPEFEALVHIKSFCDRIVSFYSPGASFDIVSDGHVFSDCQGTDDDVVDEYGLQLKKMLEEIQPPGSPQDIRFFNLRDLLFPEGEMAAFPASCLPPVHEVYHPVRTKINKIVDGQRSLMLSIWSPPETFLRDLIRTQPCHAITNLYRGFARFMLEDLRHHPDHSNASTKQRKKLAESAAMTMIQRNQTYSRMVETVLRRHVRLSIHAHDNSGPKYAIRLLPTQVFQYAEDANALLNAFHDKQAHAIDEKESIRATGHIPTPWHNCLVQVHNFNGERKMFICRSSVAREALEQGFLGGYCTDHIEGGRFILCPKK